MAVGDTAKNNEKVFHAWNGFLHFEMYNASSIQINE